MKVRELDRWPPHPSGAYRASRKIPLSDEAIINKVIYCRGGWLTLICTFEDDFVVYDFDGNDEKTCEAVKRILEENIGKSLASIDKIELN